ncbi:hypothetical protein METEAL_26190 [Mesoterricola silvestris]|uniref:Uncharacterized protein n=1 Tax=Mesoterricola silvestris TaxID=2927979 RepID=A0AA48K9U7_9BACT|nr:hypothetical protein METEAL_26190 [Mesoterricola silvestris]
MVGKRSFAAARKPSKWDRGLSTGVCIVWAWAGSKLIAAPGPFRGWLK